MESPHRQGQNSSPNRAVSVQIRRNKDSFSHVDIFLTVFSLCVYIADIITDCVIGAQYILTGNVIWGLMTLSLSLFPLFITQCISIRWYRVDGIPITTSATVMHCTMLGVVHRYMLCLESGLESRKEKTAESVQRLNHHQSSICLLRLFETFLESAPQLLLQLYIMHELGTWHPWTGICAIGSLVSLAWGMASYVRIMRKTQEEKQLISWAGLALQAVWRTGTVLARITALLLCASVLHTWFFLAIGLHWLGMSMWVISQKTDLCATMWEERIYNAIVGVIYCFCFFNLKEGRTRQRALVFYTIIAFENCACLLLFLQYAEVHREHQWFHKAAPVIIVTGTIVGHTSQLIYYRWFHPSGPIKLGSADILQKNMDNTPGTSAETITTGTNTLRSLKYINHFTRKISGVSLPSLADNNNVAVATTVPVTNDIPDIPTRPEGQPDQEIPTEENPPPVPSRFVILREIPENLYPAKLKSSSISDSHLIPKRDLEKNCAYLMKKSKSDGLILYRIDPYDDAASTCTSVHDYENMPVLNINRSNWGIRHWSSYSDIEASCHDNSTYRDREILELTASSSSETDTSSQNQLELNSMSKPTVHEAIAHLKSLAQHGHNIYQPSSTDAESGLYECVWMEGSNQNGVLVVPKEYAEIFKPKPHTRHDLSTITEESEASSAASKSSLVETVDAIMNESLLDRTLSVISNREESNPLTYMEVRFLSSLSQLESEDKSKASADGGSGAKLPRRQFSIIRDRFESLSDLHSEMCISSNKENENRPKVASPAVQSPLRRSTLSPKSRVFTS